MTEPRPLFDPDKARGATGPESPQALTVAQVTAMVKAALTRHLPGTLHVVGQLNDISRPASGHLYFTLKDAQSELRCVMWRSSAATIRFKLEEGMEVIVTGGIDVYEPRGQYQLYARKIEPRGVGALELAFRQLRQRLEKEGLFDPARKKPLPKWPRRIAVVTSPSGAAIRDILNIITRRFPRIEILVAPVRVQGEGAADEIATAIRRLNRWAEKLGGIALMIVGRGGGSLEDLWAFNEEVVARAIFDSTIPVISAVGHEVDITIADLVADVRAPTPSAAAELAVPVLQDVLATFDEHVARLTRRIGQVTEISRSRLDAVIRHEWFRQPTARIARFAQPIDEAAGRLRNGVQRRLATLAQRLNRAEQIIEQIRPQRLQQQRERAMLEALYALRAAADRRLHRGDQQLTRIDDRLRSAITPATLEHRRDALSTMQQRGARALQQAITLRKQRITDLAARLESISYHQVLARGFSITRRAGRKAPIKKATDVKAGDRVITETAEGNFESRVLDKKQGELFE